jgi:pilus assembly protein Flp/PilA
MQPTPKVVDDLNVERMRRADMVHIDFLVGWVRASLGRSDRGASLVEYALLLALIAVVCIAAVTTLGGNLSENYDENRTSIFGA